MVLLSRVFWADQKADVDTDSDNIITKHNGCMSEFIVDSDAAE